MLVALVATAKEETAWFSHLKPKEVLVGCTLWSVQSGQTQPK